LPANCLLAESESFSRPRRCFLYSVGERRRIAFAAAETVPADDGFISSTVVYQSRDGVSIPMFLVGRQEALGCGEHPVLLTAYGGFGVPVTPQFSVLVTFFLRLGCLFALPNIRGGSEFGAAWHAAARKEKRQTAYDDFLAAAEWLIATGRTRPSQLAIFGGSNSGLLVAAAMTQRPSLFRAVLCLAPLADMLRFHKFDRSYFWKDEFGTADDPGEFKALFAYSPYHNIDPETEYPGTLIVSGDKDTVCNPMHARKMTARLQAAKFSHPTLLDYDEHRGHSPVLPLNRRIDALADRIAFLCDQLGLQP
jgi:prolyl oligopeptidase